MTSVVSEQARTRRAGRQAPAPRRRLLWVALPLLGLLLLVVGFLVFGNLNRNLVYYLSPTEATQQRSDFPDGRRFRLGGLVEEGSVRGQGSGMRFVVGDGTNRVDVVARGSVAPLFRAGVGVVVEGSWNGPVFVADTMLIKHDNQYRPPAPGAVAPSAASVR